MSESAAEIARHRADHLRETIHAAATSRRDARHWRRIHVRNRQLTGGNTWLLKIPVTVVTIAEIPGAVSAR